MFPADFSRVPLLILFFHVSPLVDIAYFCKLTYKKCTKDVPRNKNTVKKTYAHIPFVIGSTLLLLRPTSPNISLHKTLYELNREARRFSEKSARPPSCDSHLKDSAPSHTAVGN
jgi:hypothetical protein